MVSRKPKREAVERREVKVISVPPARPVDDLFNPFSIAKEAESASPESNIPPQGNIVSAPQPIYSEVNIPSESNIPTQNILPTPTIEPKRFTAYPNDLLDNVLTTLDPFSQAVLVRLYRLSRGFHSETCKVSIMGLAKACNASKSQVQRSLEKLETKGIIRREGYQLRGFRGKEKGTIFRMLLPAAVLPRQGNMSPQNNIGSKNNIPRQSTNKEYLKESNVNAPHRLTPEEVTEQAGIIRDMLDESYTIEHAAAQFGQSMHPEDWEKIKEQL